MFDKQAFFTEAYTRMKAQGTMAKPTMEERQEGLPDCMYRDPRGNGCLIGVMIPTDRYDPAMDHVPEDNSGTSITANTRVQAVMTELYGAETQADWNWLQGVQNCHDRSGTPDAMFARLAKVARRNNLVLP